MMNVRKTTYAVLLLALASCAKEKPKQREEVIPVSVAVAKQTDVPVQINAIGSVQPMSTVDIRALAGGQLTRVSFREGEDVRRGQLLFSIDPRPYQATMAQAQANLARDQAVLRNAEAEAVRYADLVKKDYVTKEEYGRITSAAESARAVVAADRAAIENAQLQLSYCEIRSPLDGRTGSLLVHAGNIIKANDTTPLVTINQTQPIYVQFSVPEKQLADVRAHLGANIPVAATPQGTPNTVQGKLTFIDNTVDEKTGTITLKATYPNLDRALWPGQFVNVSVTLANRANAVVIPAQAVQNSQRGQYVYVVKQDKGVEMRPVTVSQGGDQQVVIDHGVAAGETVVTDGQLRLTPKSKVEVK